MTGWMGLLTIVVLLVVIIGRWMSPLVALIVVPTAASLLAGFGAQTATFIVIGLRSMAPVVGMFVFAILFFGVLTDAGLLDPIIRRIVRATAGRPTRLVIGTALLTLLIHLDGSGAVAFMVVIPAMLPIYDRLGIPRRVLACVTSMAAGVNFLPWTGPTMRAAASLHMTTAAIFRPLILVQLVGLLFVFAVAWGLGKRVERRNAQTGSLGYSEAILLSPLTEAQQLLRRPGRLYVNLVLAIGAIGILISGSVEPSVVFMLGTAAALMINYPHIDEQRARVDAHARAALMMAGTLLAAGAFTGIMAGSGMLTSMAGAAASLVPSGEARHIPFILGLLSMPLSLLFDPDSYYFGVLPVIAHASEMLGVAPIQIAQASLNYWANQLC